MAALLPGRAVTGTLTQATRRTNSVNGNARYSLHLDGLGAFNTKTDSAVSYDVKNIEARLPAEVTIILDSRGLVIDLEPVGGWDQR